MKNDKNYFIENSQGNNWFDGTYSIRFYVTKSINVEIMFIKLSH